MIRWITFLALAVVAQAQTVRTFDVASIKPCRERSGTYAGTASPGRTIEICQPLSLLILRAYVVYANGHRGPDRPTPIEGGPAWIDHDLYTIEAKASGHPGYGAMEGPMMQALLEDRFRLKLHRESRDVPVYALTAGKGALKVPVAREACRMPDPDQPVEPGQKRPPVCRMSPSGDGEFEMKGGTMADFSREISPRLDRNVIDRTGIPGVFDFRLPVFRRAAIAPDLPDTSSPIDRGDVVLFYKDAVEKLGLKLVSIKGPGEFLVIDHVERPSAN